MKICFLGAGSTIFAKNILGDCILAPTLDSFDIALHDIDSQRLDQSFSLISALNKKYGGKATITAELNRKKALENANFIVNAVQIGGYKPCTVTDFRIPRHYGLWQTIGDTLGIGGIMRALRTLPFLDDCASDIAEVCPNALFLNYTNPMAMLTGHMLQYTKINAVGLCHSVQSCVPHLFGYLKMSDKLEGVKWDIYGINHQAWLVNVLDKDGNDLYPEIKERSANWKMAPFQDRVRREVLNTFGYYVTESSEHNSEYMPYFIKSRYPELLLKYLIPLNEYPRRCRRQIRGWKWQSRRILSSEDNINHERSHEYGSRIIEASVTNTPFTFHGSTLNTQGLIPNLPLEACVEVPITVDSAGFHPIPCNPLPEQCAAMNRTNINVQLLTLKAHQTKEIRDIQLAAALDPHTAAELSLSHIKSMCVALYKKHHKDGFLPEYRF
ncbi:MAG: alpha-glucosidase/alpha-galactosidase [Christensenellaceae bacterium]|jgi:alpha-galactosidase|nr:alpha-glucosidase/alpha-galactosidase [Christensenellaceae bacterium]